MVVIAENNGVQLLPDATTDRFTGVIPSEVIDVSALGKDLSLLVSKKTIFDHALATRFLNMTACPWERALKNHHVEFLIGEMKRGSFRMELVALGSCICKETGLEYRVNGQHTSWARMEVSEKEVKSEHVIVLKYYAETVNDLRRLYASFDRGTPRTRANVINAYLLDLEQFHGVSQTLIKHVATGIPIWLWSDYNERRKHAPDDIAFLMQRDHAEVVNRVLGFCSQEPNINSIDFLRRASVMAAMLETFSKAHKASEDFWHAVKVGIGFSSPDDPRLRLRNTLMTTKCEVTRESKNVADRETMYRWCIAAWNAWRKGDAMKTLRVTKNRQRAK